jgi:DNA-binding NtrC family response regulator
MTEQDVILLVDDTPTNLQVLFKTLSPKGYKLLVAKDGETALETAKKVRPSLILLDIMMPGIDGYETCRRLKADPDTKDAAIIFCSALDGTTNIVQGLELGAVDYVAKPFEASEVLARVETHLTIQRLKARLQDKNVELAHELRVTQELVEDATARVEGPLLGDSKAVRELRAQVEACAESAEPVFLTGPPGAGHESVARHIHHESPRRNRAFIYVDCLGLGTNSKVDLVGTRGSIMKLGLDAQTGKWDLAGGGTLFLDRVDSLSSSAQKALATRLEEERSGAGNADVRVIAYAPDAPDKLVNNGSFDPALAKHLAGQILAVPSLSERTDDLPILVEHFIRLKAGRLGKAVEGASKRSLKRLSKHRWPGNIDELQGVLECAIVAADGPELDVDEALLDTGERVGRYRLVEKLGEGGMGQVWSAKHELLRRPAAVKLISTAQLTTSKLRESALKRFEREALVTATLRCPNTVQLYDFGVSTAGDIYYVMELLDGIDFENIVKRFGPLPPNRAISFLKQACNSLAEAHVAGLIHRDIKPPNLIACRLGLQCDFVKVLDFGIAKQADQREEMNLTGAGILGSPAFMSPEQVQSKEVSPQTDLYSLGCLAFWLLTGRLPFDAANVMAMCMQHVTGTPRDIQELAPKPVPAELEAIIKTCMEKDPAARPASAEELADRLAAVPVDEPWTQEWAQAWWGEHLVKPASG